MFRLGGRCGLKPFEVLDLSLEQFNQFVLGYEDRLFDEQILAVETGYWSAYYSNAKHPKSVSKIIETMQKRRDAQEKSPTETTEADVDRFMELERKRLNMIGAT